MKQSLNDEIQMKVEALLRVVEQEYDRSKRSFDEFKKENSSAGEIFEMENIRYNHVLKTLISDLERDIDELKEKEA